MRELLIYNERADATAIVCAARCHHSQRRSYSSCDTPRGGHSSFNRPSKTFPRGLFGKEVAGKCVKLFSSRAVAPRMQPTCRLRALFCGLWIGDDRTVRPMRTYGPHLSIWRRIVLHENHVRVGLHLCRVPARPDALTPRRLPAL